jgi:hypothetical protein
MPLAEGVRASALPDASSPLRIIALFILLSEAAASGAAAATSGATRMILAIFAVAFPLIVLGVFVWLLLKHPLNLYAPHQYTSDTSIQTFASVLRQQQIASQTILEQAVSEAVVTAVAVDGSPSQTSSVHAVRQHVADAFSEAVRAGSITIIRSVFDGAEPVKMPVTVDTTVQDLLNAIYFALVPSVGPYTYAVEWILMTPEHKPLLNIGSGWARQQGLPEDARRLTEVGLKPGMTLTVISRSHRSFPKEALAAGIATPSVGR